MNDLLFSVRKDKRALIGTVILALVILTAVSAPLIAPCDPAAQDVTRRLSPPSFTGGPRSHLLGTDALGRDILSRILFGSRISLLVSLAAVIGAGLIGSILGVVSGYCGGKVDSIIMRIVDIQMALPYLILAIAVMAVLKPGLQNVIIVLIIAGWVRYARVARAQTLVVRENQFVTSAIAIGASKSWIIFSEILPNVLMPLLIVATLEVGQMILGEATLSFLGIGVQPPTATWGGMVADGRDYLSFAWWVPTLPGLAILITVLGVNFFGDWIRDSFDPRLKNR
jgi:peptide/nickel transport system permease protein